MASYTMKLSTYIEMWSQYETGLSMAEKIEKGRPKLFDFQYPIFDESYRKVFETHFIRNFYMREIGFETEGLFKFNLETWLIINMPYFNKLFESELIKYDPLENTRLNTTGNKKNDTERNDNRDTTGSMKADGKSNTKTSDKTNATGSSKEDGKTTGSVTDDNFNRKIDSDQPDSRLNLTTNDGQGTLEYASAIEENNTNNKRNTTGTNNVTSSAESESTGSGTSDTVTTDNANTTTNDKLNSQINNVEDYIESKIGKSGTQSYASLVQDYRAALLRIEKRIFDEMQELFMLVY
ncbi:lower collar protein [Bacillus phage B103]|uniref:Proximal tail tube connector protein n=1 Tax=Bacillus phage B103 TaxID=2994042 RepID=TUB11_BPB03|nr:adaptor Ad4 [Bacillus phage B103]Q37892.1 RecName: Full=Proximal tail tube connector protein; AltName: Full=Gene product 11; Short=gp11; AltName: Full=Lower collar protein; AltName: Full=Protein p11 [Bacillus phage B103]CAA67659.1 lower collar protein [Bacillus phage B103]